MSAYVTLGNVSASAKAAGMDRNLHYDWLKADEDYAARFYGAHEQFIESLEAEADRRARDGVVKMKTHQGQLIMVPSDPMNPDSVKVPLIEHEYSDTLLIFRLKALRPGMYRDNASVDLTSGGKPLFTLNIGNNAHGRISPAQSAQDN